MSRIFFTADLHIGHKNILRHQPNRPFALENDTTRHDEWLVELWHNTIDRNDTIYILGDLTFLKNEAAQELLHKLPGRKHMIDGNHDGPIRSFSHSFIEYTPLLEKRFRPQEYPELPEPIVLVMCHYPMITWNRKAHGSIMLHGHCHGKLDELNAASTDLRFDVGIDGLLAEKCGGFIPLEAIYEAAKEKASGLSFEEYALKSYEPAVK